METYWERRRKNQEDHSPHSRERVKVNSSGSGDMPKHPVAPEEKESDGSGSRISSGSSNEKRPTKKNSQKENKKHPYKKVRK